MSYPLRNLARATLVFSALLCGCMAVYSARIQSGDTLRLFDAATSLARYGDDGRDITAWFLPPTDDYDEAAQYPLADDGFSEHLPAQVVSVVVTIVSAIPGIGLVHGTWLFNAVVTALTGAILYLWARSLWWDSARPAGPPPHGNTDPQRHARQPTLAHLPAHLHEATAVLAGLMYGLLTIALPYSKTLFREPQLALLFVLTGYLVSLWRRRPSGVVQVILLVCGVGLMMIAYLYKPSSVLMVPALMCYAAAGNACVASSVVRRLTIAVVVMVVITIAAVIAVPSIATVVAELLNRLPIPFDASGRYASLALHTYLVSIGGSLWGTSPVLLLAVPGLLLWQRSGRVSLVLLVVVGVAGYAMGHAFLTGQHWFGGVSWPPRFLVPIVPIAALATAPVIFWLLTQLASAIDRRQPQVIAASVGVVVLAVYSAWIQIVGVLLPWQTYSQLLPPEASGLIEWGGGLNAVAYLRWVVLPGAVGALGHDIAWYRAGMNLEPVFLAALLLLSAYLLISIRRDWRTSIERIAASMSVVSIAVLAFAGLRGLYTQDPLYGYGNAALRSVYDRVLQDASADDVLVLTDDRYADFFLNYHRALYPRVIALTDAPGERASPQDMVSTESINAAERLHFTSRRMLDFLAQRHRRIELLASNSLFTPWATRPAEIYLAQGYYLLDEMRTDDATVRLITFDTTRAPYAYEMRSADNHTSVRFEDGVRLDGITLPHGTSYRAGDVLPVSLLWMGDGPIENNYTVAVFVRSDATGEVVTQGVDAMPVAGSMPTSEWQAGYPVWDHRAVKLPASLEDGTYRVEVILYRFDTDGAIVRLPLRADTTPAEESDAALLPVELLIRSR